MLVYCGTWKSQTFSGGLVMQNCAKRRKSEEKEKSFAVLRFSIVDRQQGVTLNMYSRKYKVELTQDIVKFLENNDLKYSLS